MLSKSDFLVSYGKVVSRTWYDEPYRDRLYADPGNLLNEAGITVPEGVKINVIEVIPTGEGDPNAQYQLWVASAETRRFDLLVSTMPADHDDTVLYDDEIAGIAGGGCCCPCCTPCCCCSDAPIES